MASRVYSSNGVLLPYIDSNSRYFLSNCNDNATEFSFKMKIVDDNNLQNLAFMPNTLIKDVRDFMSQFILYKYNQTIPTIFISVMDSHYNDIYPDDITINEAFKKSNGFFTIEFVNKQDFLTKQMTFINVEVQGTFFEIVCTRRRKRVMYGVTPYQSIILRILFDRCLNIILCHHPHIWSYGTGNLLIAPNIPEIVTKSIERAIEWRLESLLNQEDDLQLRNSFGYYIRYSFECRERISIFRNQLNYQHGEHLQMFKYIDSISPRLNDLCVNIKVIDRIGKFRYGEYFTEGYLTNNNSVSEILKECNQTPNIKILREFMFDILDPEFATETIASLVIPNLLLYGDEKSECVVCLQEKDVLIWPCHKLHVTCTECTIELLSCKVSCPLCRQSILYKYGKWHIDK